MSDGHPWNVRLRWRYIEYSEGAYSLRLYIHNRVAGPAAVQIPDEAEWRRSAPPQILGSKRDVLQRLKSIPWNRDLEWVETPYARFAENFENVPGSLESTGGGQHVEAMSLFDPGPADKRGMVREIYHEIERLFAEAARGNVTLRLSGVDPESVFARISIPALLANEHVTLTVVEVMNAKEYTLRLTPGTDITLFLRAARIDFTRPRGESVFWSGKGNRELAERFVSESHGRAHTLNRFIADQDPELLAALDGIPQADFPRTASIWEYLSLKWAVTAS